MSEIFSNYTTHSTIPDTIVEAYHGRTILITGGRGYIGSALTQTLADVKCKLILVTIPQWRLVSIIIGQGMILSQI